VREAIRQLAGRGVLHTRQGAGVFVHSLAAGDDWDSIVRRADINSVLEARLAIEGEGAELAATRRTPADIRVMRGTLRQRGARRSDIEGHVDADMAFHRSIVASAHNDILVGLFDNMVPRLRQAMIDMLRIHNEFGSDDDQQAHADVLDAIIARDTHTARILSRAHLLALQDSIS
jgi:DNA-binding FadR family transcriptional regulator